MVSIQGRRPKVSIYVEGGGYPALDIECRKAFRKFFVKTGFSERLPKVLPCGSRQATYDDFCTALKIARQKSDIVFLLVDSEDPVQSALDKPWEHLLARDKWEMPEGATSEQAHLMVECMENWFLADREALKIFFGSEFKDNRLPSNKRIEDIKKDDVIKGLEKASQKTTKGTYGKGAHSFKILELIDANKVIEASPSAQRLVNELNKL